MRQPWTGCGTALVTPFTRDGAVEFQANILVTFVLEN